MAPVQESAQMLNVKLEVMQIKQEDLQNTTYGSKSQNSDTLKFVVIILIFE